MIINNLHQNTQQIHSKGKKVNETLEKNLKTAFDFLRKDVSLLPEEGGIERVYQEFSDPLTKDKYAIFISGNDNSSKRTLNAGYIYGDEGTNNVISFDIIKGNKHELADYLGNEKNMDEVLMWCQRAKKQAQKW